MTVRLARLEPSRAVDVLETLGFVRPTATVEATAKLGAVVVDGEPHVQRQAQLLLRLLDERPR